MKTIPPELRQRFNRFQRSSDAQIAGALLGTRQLWRHMGADVWRSWALLGPRILAVVLLMQRRAAEAAVSGSYDLMDAQGLQTPPPNGVLTEAFVGFSTAKWALEDLLMDSAATMRGALDEGKPFGLARAEGGKVLERTVTTQIADVFRQATNMAVISTPARVWTTRAVNPGACGRCIILMGLNYSNPDYVNQPFLRHPNCRCVNVVTGDPQFWTAPDDYFHNFMTEEEQNKAFGKANAELIRMGANMFDVQNARRWVYSAEPFVGAGYKYRYTTQGMTRGYVKSQILTKYGPGITALRKADEAGKHWSYRRFPEELMPRRMTPETILKVAKGDKERALRLAEAMGYMRPFSGGIRAAY